MMYIKTFLRNMTKIILKNIFEELLIILDFLYTKHNLNNLYIFEVENT